MRILHYNDEEVHLHRYLAERGHVNTVLSAGDDPFVPVREQVFDAAFVGLHPHGLQLIRALHEKNPDCSVTIVTSDHKTRMAVEAMKCGAFDYLLSPLDFTEVERTCILIAREQQMFAERRKLEDQLASASGGSKLLGTSQAARDLRRLVAKAAASRAPVLILGETGTGKELVANLLHEQSPRHARPLISINCNAIPTTLLESELFGYRKGAFTGADCDREGLLAQADGGSVYLDEVQDLDPVLQGKLLRVLEQGEIQPLGARSVVRLDLRFIAATNQDLGQFARERRFREDLFYRLNVVPITLAPLRERMEDVPILARHFVDWYCRREGRAPLKISAAVWRWLHAHHWPGNVRELENLCQRAVALAEGDLFDTDVLALSSAVGPPSPADFATAAPPGKSYRSARAGMERSLFEQTLVRHGGNVSRAAHALGISRTTFYAKARLLNVLLPRERMAHKP